MADYTELVQFLRGLSPWAFPQASNKRMQDAADAIEALNRLLDQNTQRCEALRKQLREAHESYERHLNELESQLQKRGEWIRVQEVDIPGEIHPVAFKCMCSMCRNEYLFPKIPRYCPDCGSMNTAKTEVQDEA